MSEDSTEAYLWEQVRRWVCVHVDIIARDKPENTTDKLEEDDSVYENTIHVATVSNYYVMAGLKIHKYKVPSVLMHAYTDLSSTDLLLSLLFS